MEDVMNLTRIFSIQKSGLLMGLFLAVMALCWSPGSLRAGEAEDYYKFYSYYHSKWEIVEETGGKKETTKAECYGTASSSNIFVSKKETSIWGYDPKTRQWTGAGHLKDGSRYTSTISRPQGPKFKPGMVLTFTTIIRHADGKISYVTGKQTVVDENTMTAVITGTDQDGKPIPKVVRTAKKIK
jgi:hypothetical protein